MSICRLHNLVKYVTKKIEKYRGESLIFRGEKLFFRGENFNYL